MKNILKCIKTLWTNKHWDPARKEKRIPEMSSIFKNDIKMLYTKEMSNIHINLVAEIGVVYIKLFTKIFSS